MKNWILLVALLAIITLPVVAQPNFLVRLDPDGDIGKRVLELEKVVGSWAHMQAGLDQERDRRIEKLEADLTYLRAKPIGELQKRILRIEARLK
jgi:hypothetical protein